MAMLSTENPWISGRRSTAACRIRLICFPFAGGAASYFHPWRREMPSDIEVCAVQPPGREGHLSQAPLTRISALAEAASEALAPVLDRPFAFFGHSMGALVAFEVARALRRKGKEGPRMLFASAHPAPHVAQRYALLSGLPQSKLVDELVRLNGTPKEVLSSPELLELVLPTVRADFKAVESYRYEVEEPLECPIEAFGGTGDSSASAAELEPWAAQTRGPFRLRMFPGDHFFLNTQRTLVLRTVVNDLYDVLRAQQP
jgi:medium-chain acyl-[acyl-carrier-protein] hydrolase